MPSGTIPGAFITKGAFTPFSLNIDLPPLTILPFKSPTMLPEVPLSVVQIIMVFFLIPISSSALTKTFKIWSVYLTIDLCCSDLGALGSNGVEVSGP